MTGKEQIEKFREEAQKLHNLLKDNENGCFSWHTAINDCMEKLCTIYYGYIPSGIKPLNTRKREDI